MGPLGSLSSLLSRFLYGAGKTFDRLVRPILCTRQQLRRADEIESKMEAIIARVLKDDGDQYMSLSKPIFLLMVGITLTLLAQVILHVLPRYKGRGWVRPLFERLPT